LCTFKLCTPQLFALAHVQEADIVEVFGQVKNYDDMLASEDNLIIAIKKKGLHGLHNKDLGGLGEQDAKGQAFFGKGQGSPLYL
jgi:hypothetical protein